MLERKDKMMTLPPFMGYIPGQSDLSNWKAPKISETLEPILAFA